MELIHYQLILLMYYNLLFLCYLRNLVNNIYNHLFRVKPKKKVTILYKINFVLISIN